LEIAIGDHITFVQKTLFGERRVSPPERFVIHYLKYSRSKLPRVRAVVTMPVVLANGTMLNRNGLAVSFKDMFGRVEADDDERQQGGTFWRRFVQNGPTRNLLPRMC
jgi:hypothetical protein